MSALGTSLKVVATCAVLGLASLPSFADAPPIAVIDSSTSTDELRVRPGVFIGQKIIFNDVHSEDLIVRTGVWEAGPSKTYLEDYPFTEYVLMISGHLVVVNEDGSERTFRAGDTFVIPLGWSGLWDVREHMKKQMVQIGDPKAKPKGRPVTE